MNIHSLALTKTHKIAAIILAIALLMWSMGFPAWTTRAHAASLTWISDVISDSAPGVAANHTIQFTTPTGVPADGTTITITLPIDFNVSTSSLDFNDFDMDNGSGDLTLAASCGGVGDDIGVGISGQVITLTVCSGESGAIAANGTTTIEIGTNATAGASGTHQITNAGNVGSYNVDIGGTQTDSANTEIAIIDNVLVTAAVSTTFTFVVSGLPAGYTINSSPTTTTDVTTATTLPFGNLTAGISKTLAQRLNVTTNARNGFVVTANQDQNLTSSTGADIDSFANDGASSTPAAWEGPAGFLNDENTYGHMGITSSDSDLNGGEFATDKWAGDFVGNPREVFSNDGPSDGIADDIGSTTVGFQVEIMSFQEAANDYTATLTYVATPTF